MKKLYFFFIFFFLTSVIKTEEIHLSFDNLFPISFFEQALKATMHVWHTLKYENFDDSHNSVIIYDRMLGQLTSAQFYLKQMYSANQAVHAEDVRYLHAMLAELKNAIMVYEVAATHQCTMCMVSVVEKMQKILIPVQ